MIKIEKIAILPNYTKFTVGSSALQGYDSQEKLVFKCRFFRIYKVSIGTEKVWSDHGVVKKGKTIKTWQSWYWSKYLKFYKIYI